MNIKNVNPGSGTNIIRYLNKHTLKKTLLLLLIGLTSLCPLLSQDIHYSQFYNAPLNLSPALTGIFRGDVRFMGNYRSQWRAVPVKYLTFTGAADMKFIRQTMRKGFFSGGVVFHYDQAGYSKLNLSHLGLNGSYTHRLGEKTYATAGAQLGFNQRAFKLDELTFNNQFDPGRGVYDPGLPTGEEFPNTNNFFIDFSAGFNLRLQSHSDAELVDRLEKRSKLDLGVGIFHLNQPDQSFIEDAVVPLQMRFSPYAFGTLQLSKSIDFLLNFSGQFQNPYRELLISGGGKLHLNRSLGKQLAVQLTAGYRFSDIGDGFIPALEVNYNSWKVGISYDINVSDFNIATRRRGGPEVAVHYIITKVKPLPVFKICPLI